MENPERRAAEKSNSNEDENRKIRRLQIMMNMVMSVISQDQNITVEEASELVANTKRAALNMFPDKEFAYDIIYKPPASAPDDRTLPLAVTSRRSCLTRSPCGTLVLSLRRIDPYASGRVLPRRFEVLRCRLRHHSRTGRRCLLCAIGARNRRPRSRDGLWHRTRFTPHSAFGNRSARPRRFARHVDGASRETGSRRRTMCGPASRSLRATFAPRTWAGNFLLSSRRFV